MKVPAKASILLQKVGPKLQNAQKRLYCSTKVDQLQFSLFGLFKILHKATERLYYSERLDQNYRMRKSVYIVPKKWTTDKRRKLGVKNT